MALFFIFFLLDILVLILQMKVSITHNTRIADYINQQTFKPNVSLQNLGYNFDENSIPDAQLGNLDLTLLVKQWFREIYIPTVYSNDTFRILNQNHVFNDPRMRSTIIKKNYEKHGKELDKERITINGLEINYTNPGDEASPLHKGGFVYNFPLTNAEALSVNPVDNDNYTSYNWAELIVEFLYTIPNTPEHFFGF